MSITSNKTKLLCGVVLLSTIATTGFTQNLLKNGSFEKISTNGNVQRRATHWIFENWGEKGKNSLVADRDKKSDGEQSVKIDSDSQRPNLILYQDVPTTPGTDYSLNAAVCSSKNAFVSLTFMGTKSKIVARKFSKKVNSGKFEQLTLKGQAPKNSKFIRVMLYAHGAAWFDNVVLTLETTSDIEPSNAQELKNKKTTISNSNSFNRQRMAKMTPAALEWEKLLEENLGSYYLPLYKKAKERGQETAWDFVKDNPKLPRVIIIGDSVSRGYTKPLRHLLKSKVNLHRAPANCGPTTLGLSKLDTWLQGKQWDFIYFNFGIHNRKYTVERYLKELKQLVSKLKKTNARLVWLSSTPLNGGKTYPPGSMVKLNNAAAKLMQSADIPICDLYSSAKQIQAKYQTKEGCHYTLKGYDVLADYIANDIKNRINN